MERVLANQLFPAGVRFEVEPAQQNKPHQQEYEESSWAKFTGLSCDSSHQTENKSFNTINANSWPGAAIQIKSFCANGICTRRRRR
jgi:hypothetical protein